MTRKTEALLWVDIETTGTDPRHDLMLEIGLRCTSMNAKTEYARYESVIKPGVLPTDEEIKAAANAILCIAHRQQFYVQAYWDLIDQCWRYVATDEARTAIEAMDEAGAVIEAIQGKATEE